MIRHILWKLTNPERLGALNRQGKESRPW
jgi:hypothetical protein